MSLSCIECEPVVDSMCLQIWEESTMKTTMSCVQLNKTDSTPVNYRMNFTIKGQWNFDFFG